MPLPPESVTIASEEESRRKRFSGEPLPPPKNGSDALKAIVLKACAFKPEDRFQHAGEMLDALKGKTVVIDTSAEEKPAEATVLDAAVGAFADRQKSRKKQCIDPEIREGVFGDQTMWEETDSYEEMRKKIVQQNEAKKLEEEQRKKWEQEEQQKKREQEEQHLQEELIREQKEAKIDAQNSDTQKRPGESTSARISGIIIVILYTVSAVGSFLHLYEGDSKSLWWMLPLLMIGWIPLGSVLDALVMDFTAGMLWLVFSLYLIALYCLGHVDILEINLFNYLLVGISAIIILAFWIINLCRNLLWLWIFIHE